MAALTTDRNTPERSGDRREPGVAAGARIYTGAMVALDGGFAVPMSTATDLVCLGRASRRADNTDGADGDIRVPVTAGIHRYDNSAGGDLITTADIGATCFGVDDQTVAKTNGTDSRSAAGIVFDVDDQGVWVKFS